MDNSSVDNGQSRSLNKEKRPAINSPDRKLKNTAMITLKN